jgi:hypothetical protein
MEVGNVITITSTQSDGLIEDAIIKDFSGRRLREDYADDTDPTLYTGRRLASGAGPVGLVHPLSFAYTTATIVVTSASVVGGDPITRYGSTSVKFWLTNFELTPLLRTTHINVYASTFPGPSSDLQWFERFVITSADESPIVKVAIKKDIKLNRTTPPRIFSQLDVTIMDAPSPLRMMDPIHVGRDGHELWEDYATNHGQVRFRVGRQLHSPPRVYSKSYEYVHIVTPDLVFAIVPAHAAVEFRSEWFTGDPGSAHKYAHLDMFIIHQVGESNFGGILPQLWGLQPMSEEVRAMTQAPVDGNQSNETSVCAGACQVPQVPIVNI